LLWLLFAQSLDTQSLITGWLVAGLITFVNRDLLLSFTNDLHISRRNLSAWLTYVRYLIIDVVKASVQVAELAFARKLDIKPQFVTHASKLKEPMMRVFLANSITLTPGTISVEAPAQGDFVVHALTDGAAAGLADWHIENLLVEIERRH
jgi:multicomponent Na+:H+ antiporter subunit E